MIADVVAMRLQLRLPEARRTERLREVIAASDALSHSLAVHAQRAGVVRESTRVAGELSEETADLYEKLSRYAFILGAVAAEFRPLVGWGSAPDHDVGKVALRE